MNLEDLLEELEELLHSEVLHKIGPRGEVLIRTGMRVDRQTKELIPLEETDDEDLDEDPPDGSELDLEDEDDE